MNVSGRILIIDDEESIRKSFRLYLEDQDYSVLEAENGRRGLEVFERERPDLVLVDLRMPEIDGLEVLKRIEQDSPATPLIVISGTGVVRDAVQALRLGAWDYLLKPLEDLTILKHAVEKALERARLIRENRLYQEHLEEEIGKRTEELQLSNAILAENEAKFVKIFQSSPDAIIITRRSDGAIIDINDACVQIIGYSREEAIGLQNFAQDLWARPDDRTKINALLEEKESCTNYDTLFKTRDGRIVEALFSARIFELKGEEYIISIARDMTAQHQLENQLIHSQRMESIGRLAGGVAHDFNNLLTPILGYAEIILKDMFPQDRSYEHISQIHRAAENAKHLTRQLLAFSRKQVLEMKPVNLNQVIIGFQKILRRTIREDIAIELRTASDVAIIEADESQLEQILMNLAVNAQDAIAESGTITIATADVMLAEGSATEHLGIMPGPYVELTFNDTGSGVDPEIMDHLFEPFFTTKMPGKGTGLGLSTIYGIVTQHRGGILVQSDKGIGTTFKIYLPCVQAPTRTPTIDQRASGSQGGTETVLVVEDNDAVRTLAVQILGKNGYQVLDAEDPRQGLALMQESRTPVALVLTDVVMPAMNGRDLYESLRLKNPGLKVLYMSGYSDDVIAHHGVLDQGVNFIQKPFTVQGLLEKVRAVLDA